MTRPDEYICSWPACGRVFNRASKLADHENLHSGIRPYVCGTCSKSFSRPDHLKRHTLIHAELLSKYSCDVCLKTFKLRHHLNRHSKVHNGKKLEYECEVCKEKFSKTDKLINHRALLHNILSEVKCDKCEKMFQTPKQLKKHQRRHEKIYSCEFCEMILPNWSSLVDHRRANHARVIQTDAPLRIFKCGECDKVFSSQSALKVHVNTVHLLQKPFKCNNCLDVFGHKHLLLRHSRKCITEEHCK